LDAFAIQEWVSVQNVKKRLALFIKKSYFEEQSKDLKELKKLLEKLYKSVIIIQNL